MCNVRAAPGALLALCLVGIAGCGLIEDIYEREDTNPGAARVIVTGTAAQPLRLVLSSHFRHIPTADRQGTIELIRADTLHALPPIDRSHDLTGDRVGFFARLTHLDTALAVVRMQVLIDGERHYDVTAELRDASLEFSFIYGQ